MSQRYQCLFVETVLGILPARSDSQDTVNPPTPRRRRAIASAVSADAHAWHPALMLRMRAVSSAPTSVSNALSVTGRLAGQFWAAARTDEAFSNGLRGACRPPWRLRLAGAETRAPIVPAGNEAAGSRQTEYLVGPNEVTTRPTVFAIGEAASVHSGAALGDPAEELGDDMPMLPPQSEGRVSPPPRDDPRLRPTDAVVRGFHPPPDELPAGASELAPRLIAQAEPKSLDDLRYAIRLAHIRPLTSATEEALQTLFSDTTRRNPALDSFVPKASARATGLTSAAHRPATPPYVDTKGAARMSARLRVVAQAQH